MRTLVFLLLVSQPLFSADKGSVELGIKASPYCILTHSYEFAGFLSCIGHDVFVRYHFSQTLGLMYSNSSFLRSEKDNQKHTIETTFNSHAAGLVYHIAPLLSLSPLVRFGTTKQSRFDPQDNRIDSKEANGVLGFAFESNFTPVRYTYLSPEVTAGYLHYNAGTRSNFVYLSFGLVFTP